MVGIWILLPMKLSEIFSLGKLNLKRELGVVVHTCKSSTYLEVEAGRLWNPVFRNTKQNKTKQGLGRRLKSICYSCRGPKLSAQHLGQEAHHL